ncbi:MAG TPA: Hsp20/alpha crystallin family protein [Dehalococcoidia bacterium]|nr:Hsp20/alpha crystallin family protein [Dehalococcoidia bacterium]
MPNIIRWGPFTELDQMRHAMDSIFGEFHPFRPEAGAEVGYIPLDVAETDDGFEVEAALPGLKPDDVEVQVHGDTVTIRGEAKEETEEKDKNWLRRERRYGMFARSFTLPTALDAEKAAADFQNGVLKLHLPKSEAGRPKTIKVGSGMIEGKKG